jgi:hypothetical protein
MSKANRTAAAAPGIKDVFAFGLAGAAAAVLLALLIPLRQLPDHDSKKLVAFKNVLNLGCACSQCFGGVNTGVGARKRQ